MIVGRCDVCGAELDDAVVSIARRIIGWEHVRRGSGGANGVIDRQVLTRVAHVECVKQRAARRRRGIADGQETLA